MRSLSCRRIAVVAGLAALLTATGPIPTALASPAPPPSKPASVPTVLTADQALAQAKATGTNVAVPGATTPTDTLTANPDGTLTLNRTMLPVRKRVAGAWKNLDATLTHNSDGTLSPAVTTTHLTLSGGGTGPLVTLHANDGTALALTLPMTLPAPTLNGDTATYPNVLPGVDLQVTADTQGGISEVLVVNNATAATNPALKPLAFATSTTGVSLHTDAAGNITATNSGGQAMFTAPAPLMWDSTAASPPPSPTLTDPATGSTLDASTDQPLASTADGPGEAAHTAPVTVTTTSTGLDLTPDQALLTGSATTYPVYIDPSWSTTEEKNTGWATIAKQFPDTNYWKKTTDPVDGIMQVGQGEAILSRTLIDFPIPYGALSGAVINSATMTITENYSWSCNDRQVDLYAPATTLTSGNATWSDWSGQNLGGIIDHKTVAYGYNSSCPASGVGFTVTGVVNSDVTNHKGTQTFALLADNESDQYSWKKFVASTAALTITYDHPPATPTALHTSPVTSCTANPPTTIGDSSVSLYASVSDPDGGSLGVTYSLWRTSDHQQVASSNPSLLTYGSGTTAVLVVPEATLKTAAGTSPSEFSWHVQVTDTTYTSNPSTTCNFIFDPTRTGKPEITPPSDGTTIGTAATFTVDPPSTGTTPTSYEYQLNGTAPNSARADGSGKATITIKPTGYTNTLTVTSLSAGGNIGDTASLIFNSAAPALASPNDLTGDGNADLLTPGGTNNLSPGLWLATGLGTGEVSPAALNIGANGNGEVGDNAPNDFTGSQIVAGHFTGGQLQDVLAYYPATDANHPAHGVVLAGDGDGSTIQAQNSGYAHTVSSDELQDFNGDYPTQIANAGNSASLNDGYPDLIATSGDSTIGYHLDYYPNDDEPGQYQVPDSLVTNTPDGTMDWNNWTITTCQLADGSTDMYLWNQTTGALDLWTNLTLTQDADGNSDLGHNPDYTLADGTTSTWNKNNNVTLQAADFNNDTNDIPDLWAIGTDGTATPWLTTLGTTPTISQLRSQSLNTPTHGWYLNTISTGTVSAPDGAGSTLGLTGTSGATWNTGDLYDPDVSLDGTTGALTTSTPALATNADFTASVWVKPATAGGVALSENGTNTAALKIWAEASDSSWRVAMPTTDTTNPTYDTAAASPGTLRLGIWSQLTVTFNKSTGVLTLYIDGVTAASVRHSTTWNNTAGNFHIGNTRTSSSGYGSYLNGQISSIQVWNHVVTPTQTTTPASYYQAITPTRFLDTRTTGNGAPVAAGAVTKLQITGRNGVPTSDVTAVAVNITATAETSSGTVRVYPDNTPLPLISSLNYSAGVTTSNYVIIAVGNDGYIDIYNDAGGTAQFLADVSGYFTSNPQPTSTPTPTTYLPVTPTRILDTRSGLGAPTAPLTGGGNPLVLKVTGTANIPTSGVTAVVINLIATNATNDSFLVAYADGATRPATSSNQYHPQTTTGDTDIVPVGTNGAIDIYAAGGSTDVLADISGYFTTNTNGMLYHSINVTRMLDTRLDGGAIPANAARQIPQGTTAIANNPVMIVNITATQPTTAGFATVYANGSPSPGTSNIDWTTGATVPSLALTRTNNAAFDIYNHSSGTVQIIIDCLGYFSTN